MSESGKESKVKYTPKELIENILLANLEDHSSVAIILNENDLTSLINSLISLQEYKKTYSLNKRSEFVDEFLKDLEKLRKGVFG